jgi:50S ribosomal protein L16 3-hydroxylase
VRQAWPGVKPPLSRAALFALAGSDDVESRLVVRQATVTGSAPRADAAACPCRPCRSPQWTCWCRAGPAPGSGASAAAPFRFVPEARLDDLMVSYASDGAVSDRMSDAYDVFLLQVSGDAALAHRPGCARPFSRRPAAEDPAKSFEPEHDWVLEPGDMLYLPPLWAHDGVAVGGDCMTASIGFRAPASDELAQVLLARLADEPVVARPRRYRDAGQQATARPGEIPQHMRTFAQEAVQQALRQPGAVERALGEWLTEPKPQVWFDASRGHDQGRLGVRADRRTRMAYDATSFFINGESYRYGGRDAEMLRHLADRRSLDAAQVRHLGAAACVLVTEWLNAGWLHPQGGPDDT